MQFNVRPPDRKRFRDAFRHGDTAEVSYFDCEFGPAVVSAVLGKECHERSYALPAHDCVEFAHRVGLDVCYVTVPWWLGREPYTDETGMVRYGPGTLRTRADFARIEPPQLDVAKRRIEEFLRAREGTQLGWIASLPTPASIIVMAMGNEHYYTSVYDDPSFIEEFIARCEEPAYQASAALLSYRPDAVFLGAGVCFKTGLAMSPEMTERFVFAHLKKHMALLQDADVPVIMHSDGDNCTVMDRWIELGFSGFHPVEPSENCSIYEYKRRWGRDITFCGNIDCGALLSWGSPEEVARDTLEHLERLSPGGRYICGSSHDIGDSVPLENLRAMAETVASYHHDCEADNNEA